MNFSKQFTFKTMFTKNMFLKWRSTFSSVRTMRTLKLWFFIALILLMKDKTLFVFINLKTIVTLKSLFVNDDRFCNKINSKLISVFMISLFSLKAEKYCLEFYFNQTFQNWFCQPIKELLTKTRRILVFFITLSVGV